MQQKYKWVWDVKCLCAQHNRVPSNAVPHLGWACDWERGENGLQSLKLWAKLWVKLAGFHLPNVVGQDFTCALFDTRAIIVLHCSFCVIEDTVNSLILTSVSLNSSKTHLPISFKKFPIFPVPSDLYWVLVKQYHVLKLAFIFFWSVFGLPAPLSHLPQLVLPYTDLLAAWSSLNASSWATTPSLWMSPCCSVLSQHRWVSFLFLT